MVFNARRLRGILWEFLVDLGAVPALPGRYGTGVGWGDFGSQQAFAQIASARAARASAASIHQAPLLLS